MVPSGPVSPPRQFLSVANVSQLWSTDRFHIQKLLIPLNLKFHTILQGTLLGLRWWWPGKIWWEFVKYLHPQTFLFSKSPMWERLADSFIFFFIFIFFFRVGTCQSGTEA